MLYISWHVSHIDILNSSNGDLGCHRRHADRCCDLNIPLHNIPQCHFRRQARFGELTARHFRMSRKCWQISATLAVLASHASSKYTVLCLASSKPRYLYLLEQGPRTKVLVSYLPSMYDARLQDPVLDKNPCLLSCLIYLDL